MSGASSSSSGARSASSSIGDRREYSFSPLSAFEAMVSLESEKKDNTVMEQVRFVAAF